MQVFASFSPSTLQQQDFNYSIIVDTESVIESQQNAKVSTEIQEGK